MQYTVVRLIDAVGSQIDAPPTFIGNRKLSSFPMNANWRSNSKPAWTNAGNSLILGFVWWSSWKWSQGPIPKLQTSWRQRWALPLYEPHIYPRIKHPMSRRSQHPQWEDWAGLSLFYHLEDNKHISIFNKRFQAENRRLHVEHSLQQNNYVLFF